MVNVNWQTAIDFWKEYTDYGRNDLNNIEGKQLLNAWDVLLAELDELVAELSLKTGKEQTPRGKKNKESRAAPKKDCFTFRATCARSGNEHAFTSREVEMQVGGILHDGFGWEVDLTKYDMEVYVIVRNNLVSYCLSLTKKSLHRRNEVQRLGNMSLRSTISYNMLRLCQIQPGEIVMDPMCGSGAVIVESILSEIGSFSFHISGDFSENVLHAKAQPSLQGSIAENKLSKGADCMAINVENLPFRTASIDVIVADMPFGKRSGSVNRNRYLYRNALREFARVLVPSTGRACLLTTDSKNLNFAINQRVDTDQPDQPEKVAETDKSDQHKPCFWLKPYRSFTIHHGGLNPLVFLLRRSAIKF